MAFLDETGLAELWSVICDYLPRNYAVVGGADEPTNPVENTFWVQTEIEIPDYAFSVNPPDTADEGFVWVEIGAEAGANIGELGRFDFRMAKKIPVLTTPLNVYQSVGGNWVQTSTLVYRNGAWGTLSGSKYWFANGLFTNGIQLDFTRNSSISGEVLAVSSPSPSNSSNFAVGWTNKIDFTEVKTLHARVKTTASYQSYPGCGVGLVSEGAETGSYLSWSAVASAVTGQTTKGSYTELIIDCSGIEGEYRIEFGGYCSATIDAIWPEY